MRGISSDKSLRQPASNLESNPPLSERLGFFSFEIRECNADFNSAKISFEVLFIEEEPLKPILKLEVDTKELSFVLTVIIELGLSLIHI